MSDYIRAVAETTDEQAAQLAVEAAGAPPAWASGLEEAQVGLALGGACQGAGRGAGRSVHSIRASGSSGTGLNEAAATAAHALDIARQNRDPAAEMLALYAQEAAAACAGDGQLDLSGMRQAGDIDPAAVPGHIVRRCISA